MSASSSHPKHPLPLLRFQKYLDASATTPTPQSVAWAAKKRSGRISCALDSPKGTPVETDKFVRPYYNQSLSNTQATELLIAYLRGKNPDSNRRYHHDPTKVIPLLIYFEPTSEGDGDRDYSPHLKEGRSLGGGLPSRTWVATCNMNGW